MSSRDFTEAVIGESEDGALLLRAEIGSLKGVQTLYGEFYVGCAHGRLVMLRGRRGCEAVRVMDYQGTRGRRDLGVSADKGGSGVNSLEN